MTAVGVNDAPPHDLMMVFASLGTNCEFGFAQRAYGAETFDLLRWAGTSLPILIRLLNERLNEIGDPEQIELLTSATGEIAVSHRKYRFRWHTFVQRGRMSQEALHRRECARLSRMAEILIDHLTAGDRIFVVSGAGVSRESVEPLVEAVRTYGRAPLLFVTEAESRSQVGKVEIIGDGLLQGYIEKFADPAQVPVTTDAAAWLQLCQAATCRLREMDGIAPELAVKLRNLRKWTSEEVPKEGIDREAATQVRAHHWDEAEALAAAQQAVALEPGEAEYHADLGWLLARRGEYEAAAVEFQAAVSLKPHESRYENALENARVAYLKPRLIAKVDEVVFGAVAIGLQDAALAKRVLASVFPVLHYFTPWAALCKQFPYVDDTLKGAIRPLLDLCVVDEEFYLQQYPGLRDAIDNGLKSLSEHWRDHGYFEGRVWRNDGFGVPHRS